MIDDKYKKYKIKSPASKDDLNQNVESVSKAKLYKDHMYLEEKINSSPKLEFLKKKQNHFEVIQIDENRKKKFIIEGATPKLVKSKKKVNFSKEAILDEICLIDNKALTGNLEILNATGTSGRKYLFDVEEFNDLDFEFLEKAKKITKRKVEILRFFYDRKAFENDSISIGSRNPSKTIFFKKRVLLCEDKTKKKAVRKWFTKTDVEDHLKLQNNIKKKKISNFIKVLILTLR
jgi:hypothetical protein